MSAVGLVVLVAVSGVSVEALRPRRTETVIKIDECHAAVDESIRVTWRNFRTGAVTVEYRKRFSDHGQAVQSTSATRRRTVEVSPADTRGSVTVTTPKRVSNGRWYVHKVTLLRRTDSTRPRRVAHKVFNCGVAPPTPSTTRPEGATTTAIVPTLPPVSPSTSSPSTTSTVPEETTTTTVPLPTTTTLPQACTRTRVSAEGMGRSLTSVALSADKTKLYAVNQSPGVVYVIDIATKAVVSTVGVPDFRTPIMIFSGAGTTAYVVTSQGVLVLDTATGEFTHIFDHARDTLGGSAVISADGSMLYTLRSGPEGTDVAKLSLTDLSGVYTSVFPVTLRAANLALSGTKLIVAHPDNARVSIFDMADEGKGVITVTVGAEPIHLVGGDGKVFVTSGITDKMWVIDTMTDTVIKVVQLTKTSAFPFRLTIADGKLYLVRYGEPSLGEGWGTVEVVDIATLELVGVIRDVGDYPSQIVVDGSDYYLNNAVSVTPGESGGVMIIDCPSPL